jgi:GAF domain-containing protein
MSLRPLSSPGASVADLAAIELRRITDVLQVDHVSLFLPDPDDPERTAPIASTGTPLDQALPTHASVVARAVATGRVQEVHHAHGDPRGARSALAAPLLDARRPIGALLVVTLRECRRFGLFEAQMIAHAAETLVARILAPMPCQQRRGRSDRFVRDVEPSRRLGAGQ